MHMQVKPGNKTKDLAIEIRKHFYLLYQAKELKKIYSNKISTI